ncbi:MAG: bifunctional DNA primase/polymerase [Pseudonocardiaceae bacterium]
MRQDVEYTPLDAAWVAAVSREDHEEAARLEPLVEHPPSGGTAAAALVSAALWYAEQGHPVFPCQPGGKQPACAHGFHDATTDPDRIRAWWTKQPHANIGLPTGHSFDVFDFDGDPDGLWAFNEATRDGDLPRLRGIAATPRGMHLYVPAIGIANKVGIYPGVDYRGAGGYVVVPPSRTPTGFYLWLLPLEKG